VPDFVFLGFSSTNACVIVTRERRLFPGSGFFSSSFVNSKLKILRMSLASETVGIRILTGISRKFCKAIEQRSETSSRRTRANRPIPCTETKAIHRLYYTLTEVYVHEKCRPQSTILWYRSYGFIPQALCQCQCQCQGYLQAHETMLVVAEISIYPAKPFEAHRTNS
jgi:hypothetical protein